MKHLFYLIFILFNLNMTYSQDLQTDKLETNSGEIEINFVKHASLFFEFDGKIIHIDPVLRMGNYENYPKADLILITHHHGDHMDLNAIDLIKKENTKIILTKKCHELSENLSEVIIMQNGDVLNINQLEIEAIPAYNMIHKRESGEPYHPKGEGNGYIIKFGNKKVLVAGDTENIPEIKELKNIDIAFLPMNLPYTMTPEMVADAAKAFRPKVLYPYHYSNTDTSILIELLKNEKDIEVRIKKM
ncbi:MAG TPA: metal-dependent hydrolase [Bacteroidales bacterium]|nr:metal-dependent hydrolase [Bacteroidales bacterium]